MGDFLRKCVFGFGVCFWVLLWSVLGVVMAYILFGSATGKADEALAARVTPSEVHVAVQSRVPSERPLS